MIFKSRKNTSGFTMLEVVAAMAVGAIGVIAFAGLQLKSAEITEESRERAIAAYLANETMERMMMNAQDDSAKRVYRGETGTYWNTSYGGVDYSYRPIDQYEYGCFETDCDPMTRAISDIREVKYLAVSLLPGGNIRYRACGPSGQFDCIVVAWEEANALTCGFGTDGSGLTDCYILQGLIWF